MSKHSDSIEGNILEQLKRINQHLEQIKITLSAIRGNTRK